MSRSRLVQALLLGGMLALLPLVATLLPGLARTSVVEGADPAQGSFTRYLPITSRNFPLPPSIFGGEISSFNTGAVAPLAREAGLTWIRYNSVSWSKVEPTPGARNWQQIAVDEARLIALSQIGQTPILIVRGTPSWAQRNPGTECGPVKEESLDEFATFMKDLVTRLSAPPYNVYYYEIYNEPDVDPSLVAANSIFGCWGNKNDDYYGGGYYAEMLKRIYPAIKQANPRAQVLLGGLLLFCDHTNPTSCIDPKPSKFFEGVLRNGGGAAFDIVSYHGYPLWGAQREDWDLNFGVWAHRGGVVLGKLDFIRTTMAQYGVNKPVILTEGGLICHRSGACPMPSLRNDQANYAVRLYSRTLAKGLKGTLWYTFDESGWRDSGLVTPNGNGTFDRQPGFYTIKFLAEHLSGARLTGETHQGSLEGYTFTNAGKTIRVYWSNNSSTASVPLPANSTVYNELGNAIPAPGSTLTVGFQPRIIITN